MARTKECVSALYAFSADPITYGHINIVERIATCFSRCIVGIGQNPIKQYLFNLDERRKLAQRSLSHLTNVEVFAFDGMSVDFAFEQGANVIVKGIRTAADMEYEQVLHQVGNSQELGIDTHILFAAPQLAHISSSAVKGIHIAHGFIHQYVPPIVKAALESRLSQQLIIGLTGDIASGKSTLSQQLIKAGKAMDLIVHNIDLDQLGHQILAGENIGEPMHRELIKSLVQCFGKDVMLEQTVNRKKLADIIFDSLESRRALNALMIKPMSILLKRALKNKQGLILINGALLADLDLLALCNFRCVLCSVHPKDQLKRLQHRGLDSIQAEKRLAAQLNGDQKQNLIEHAISQARFGRLWLYDNGSARSLLQQILYDCEEFSWKA